MNGNLKVCPVEKHSSLQFSPYWLKMNPPFNDWLRLMN